jgi:hypothetical protein
MDDRREPGRRVPKEGKGAGFKGIGGERSTPPNAGGLAERLAHKADPEHRLFGLVQQLHLPFALLLQASGNAANKVAANLGHLGPGIFTALEFGSVVGSPRIATMADPEKIQRHD